MLFLKSYKISQNKRVQSLTGVFSWNLSAQFSCENGQKINRLGCKTNSPFIKSLAKSETQQNNFLYGLVTRIFKQENYILGL